MNAAELVVQKRVTREYIAYDPITVQFTRSIRTRNGRGAYDTTQQLLQPQRVRLVKSPLPRHRGAAESTTVGTTTVRKDRIIGEVSLDVQAGDTFPVGASVFLVSMVMDKPHQIEAVIEEQ